MKKQNYIYEFDVEILFTGVHDETNKIIQCSKFICENARKIVTKGDSILFYQINQIAPKYGLSLEESIIVLDFSNFMKSHKVTDLIKYEEGFEIYVHNIDEDGIENDNEIKITVTDFLKSNSMSRECKMYYLNSSNKNFNKEIQDVVYFKSIKEKNNISLSKLYAYSGTLCSDCVAIIDGISFKKGELVVINDKEVFKNVDKCITAISSLSVYEHIKSFNKEYIKKKRSDYDNSFDYNFLMSSLNYRKVNSPDSEICELLDEFESSKKVNFDNLKNIIEKYSKVQTTNEVKWDYYCASSLPVCINMFDGEGLISPEFKNELLTQYKKITNSDKYDHSSSIQIRLPYVKGMVHECDFKSFFKENGIKSIKDIDKISHPIDNVKIILTESMFKAIKFLDDKTNKTNQYIDFINQYKHPIGIVGANLEEKDNVSLEYQFIASLPLERSIIEKLIKTEENKMNKEVSIDEIRNYLSANEKEIYDFSKEFYFNTESYIKKRRDIFSSNKEKAMFGKFRVYGTRKYASGDLLELLYWAAGMKIDESKMLPSTSFYMPSNKKFINEAVLLRSPHYSRNEIVISTRHNDQGERNKYFGHLNGIIMINPISLFANRLGGCDYDGDTLVVVTQKDIVNCSRNICLNYPTAIIPSLGASHDSFTYKSKIICVQNTFSSRVGEISLYALNDIINVYSNKDAKEEDLQRIASYTILSGLEIDSAKNGKKPKLPKANKKEKNDKEKMYDLFLQAKKEFDKKNYYLLSKKDFQKNLYDSIKKYMISFDETKIDSFFSSNPILNVFYKSYEIKQEKIKRENPPALNINENTIDKDSIELYAIIQAYKECNNFISKISSKESKQSKKYCKSKLLNIINEILLFDNTKTERLISNFDLNGNDAYEKLNEYLNSPSKYHYLKTQEEKRDFIENLKINLNEESISIINEEKNENYRLLYLILLYKKYSNVDIKLGERYQKMQNRFLSEMEKDPDLRKIYDDKYKLVRDELESIINTSSNPNKIKYKMNEIIEKKIQVYSLKQIMQIVDIYNSNLTFTIFKKKVLNGREVISNGNQIK